MGEVREDQTRRTNKIFDFDEQNGAESVLKQFNDLKSFKLYVEKHPNECCYFNVVGIPDLNHGMGSESKAFCSFITRPINQCGNCGNESSVVTGISIHFRGMGRVMSIDHFWDRMTEIINAGFDGGNVVENPNNVGETTLGFTKDEDSSVPITDDMRTRPDGVVEFVEGSDPDDVGGSDLEELFKPGNIETIAQEIKSYSISKEFFTPHSILSNEYMDDVTFSMADAMLGKLMLVSCEVSEAAEAVRNGDRDEFEEELVDIIIRTLGICAAIGMDTEKVLADKMRKNWDRPLRHGKVTTL